ncbi:CPBP family glutamic-type intramembrane protease [Plebeiibacterium sediminum]|uniref:CPBP family glutamic-type intramembrane protease n=1 Tax=Plebeiibacterium sediminum TaxID=2992112 RepID=A0AAE3SHM1_9BACT|nr:CPBP family glutamic-type intramembrane protease [Plebeiobacterium sediminum]MCW3789586.1 CPBP family glutamic-type intramembrane protease [Plebeiobacterium sediminum]
MNKLSVRQDLFAFLKAPNYNSYGDLNIKQKLIVLVKIYLLAHIGLIIVSIPVAILKKNGMIGDVVMKTTKTLEWINSDFRAYRIPFFISVAVTIPIIEELSFRLQLSKFNHKYIRISLSALLATFAYMFVAQYLWMPKAYYLIELIRVLYIVLFSVIFYSVSLNFKNRLKDFEHIWNNNSGIVFYTIAALFGVLHIFNLEIRTQDLFFLPLILLPFFIYGLTFGYMRIRFGLIYSVLLHMMVNGSHLLLSEVIKPILKH